MLQITVLIQMLLGKRTEAAIVAALLLANAVLPFLEEDRANRALTLLRGRLKATALVLRDGVRRSAPASELVPGDWTPLNMGDLSPVDVRIVEWRLQLDRP